MFAIFANHVRQQLTTFQVYKGSTLRGGLHFRRYNVLTEIIQQRALADAELRRTTLRDERRC
jgi:hypothetical protein